MSDLSAMSLETENSSFLMNCHACWLFTWRSSSHRDLLKSCGLMKECNAEDQMYVHFDYKMRYQFLSNFKGSNLNLELFPSGQPKLSFH